jgi:hypothetical protein
VSGLAPPRKWDAVASATCRGVGDECVFVFLADGRTLIEEGEAQVAECAREALATLDPPYRAVALRRHGETWAVGAVAIEVAELSDLDGEELTYVIDEGGERSLTVDGRPRVGVPVSLDEAVRGRHAAFVLQAARLDADLWEVSVDPL